MFKTEKPKARLKSSTNSPLDLTIAIPAKNEERNLSKCLECIGKGLVAKIVIIDSSSTDATAEIAKQYKIELLNFKWDGKFPKKRNWFLINHTPPTKWILFLDADEYLTNDFKREVREKLRQDNKSGYWLNYTTHFMGKKLKGGYPLKKLALFRVGSGLYEEVDEKYWSQMDMEVHEHPILKGEVGEIKSKIDHQDFKGISHFINKHSEYAHWEAERYLHTIRHHKISCSWTWRQRLKYRLVRSIFIGPTFFLGTFFIFGGFRDGFRGLKYAFFKMCYFNRIYKLIRERQNA